MAGQEQDGITRRRMVGYLIAGPTLVAGASITWPQRAQAALPTVQPVDQYDLSDLLLDSTLPTASQIYVRLNPDGNAYFDMPRAEVGQGITTAAAMIIADELDLPIDRVHISLKDADPNLGMNQLTAGSSSMYELWDPLRAAAAAARGQMTRVAAQRLGVPESALTVADGVISGGGGSITYGELATAAAVSQNQAHTVRLKPKAATDLKLIGTEQRRIDARAAVTGTKVFAMDLKVPGALPVMLCRAPTINGSPQKLLNKEQILAMPGVTDVAIIPHQNASGVTINGGVAVRAETFGQCIDAVRAMQVQWTPGPVAGKNADDVLAQLRSSELPLSPGAGTAIEKEFIFHFRPGDPLETNCAVADVHPDRAEIWSSLKSPIQVQKAVSGYLGIPVDAVKVHVTEGGGSFGRHLYGDGAMEAVAASKAMGKPVRLMWARSDGPRQGRAHPMCIVRNRATHDGSQVTTFSQRFTSVATDQTQGFGDALTASLATLPQGNLGYSQTVYNLTASVPYNFGPVDMVLNEVDSYSTFNTSSVRNIYSPEVRTSIELVVDELAKAFKQDPLEFRLAYARDDRMKAVLAKLKKVSNWGRAMPAGTAQGVAVHREYKGFVAMVVEVDARPSTVRRHIVGGKGGPRVTRVTCVVDVGLAINPLGLKAQMMGGIMDGIGQVFTYCLHLKDGAFLEASWDNAFYTRQWNVPPRVDVHVMPPTTGRPGGAGEFGVAASMAATACAYSRAVGKMQTEFPVTYHDLGFKPYPFVPPIPPSPTNGLKYRQAPKQRH